MQPHKTKIKWGILGPGKIARKFALGLSYLEDAEIYAVASRSIERAQKFAEETGTKKVFDSYLEMVQDEELDVVYVATPHVFHYEHSILCLKNKKAVLCEKPFAINKAQVLDMIETARQENTFLMEAMWTLFLPHFLYVMQIIESGELGAVKAVKADFGFDAPYSVDGRLFNKNLGGGSLLDIGIYPIFVALVTLGKPESIEAHASMGKTKVDEDCSAIFNYPEGVQAEIKSSIIEKTPTTAFFEMEKGNIKINSRFHEPASVEVTTKEGTRLKEFDVKPYGYQFEAIHVQEMLRKNRIESDQMTFQKSLDLIELLDKVREKIGLEYQL